MPSNQYPIDNEPLTAEEVVNCFKERWGVSYDIQIVVRNKSLYLQIMWGYLEQQSFPLKYESYLNKINYVIEIVNRTGQSFYVRDWINNVNSRPRIGRPLTLPLRTDESSMEYMI